MGDLTHTYTRHQRRWMTGPVRTWHGGIALVTNAADPDHATVEFRKEGFQAKTYLVPWGEVADLIDRDGRDWWERHHYVGCAPVAG